MHRLFSLIITTLLTSNNVSASIVPFIALEQNLNGLKTNIIKSALTALSEKDRRVVTRVNADIASELKSQLAVKAKPDYEPSEKGVTRLHKLLTESQRKIQPIIDVKKLSDIKFRSQYTDKELLERLNNNFSNLDAEVQEMIRAKPSLRKALAAAETTPKKGDVLTDEQQKLVTEFSHALEQLNKKFEKYLDMRGNIDLEALRQATREQLQDLEDATYDLLTPAAYSLGNALRLISFKGILLTEKYKLDRFTQDIQRQLTQLAQEKQKYDDMRTLLYTQKVHPGQRILLPEQEKRLRDQYNKNQDLFNDMRLPWGKGAIEEQDSFEDEMRTLLRNNHLPQFSDVWSQEQKQGFGVTIPTISEYAPAFRTIIEDLYRSYKDVMKEYAKRGVGAAGGQGSASRDTFTPENIAYWRKPAADERYAAEYKENIAKFEKALALFEIPNESALQRMKNNVNEIAKLKKLWKALSVKHHPDRGGTEEKIKEINASYDILKEYLGIN